MVFVALKVLKEDGMERRAKSRVETQEISFYTPTIPHSKSQGNNIYEAGSHRLRRLEKFTVHAELSVLADA